MLDLRPEVGLGGFLHFSQNHPADFFRGEFRLGILGTDVLRQTNDGFSLLVFRDLVRKELLVFLHGRVVEIPPDQSLDVEEGTRGILGGLILGGVADQPTAAGRSVFRKADVGGGDAVALFVRANIDPVVSPDADARVGRSQIDSDAGTGNPIVVSCAAPPSEDIARHPRAVTCLPAFGSLDLTNIVLILHKRLECVTMAASTKEGGR
mmetsp:Transcript_26049/g.61181  ORF Transcript_26049/g.61181 Transcript_26049/m.61181 type:complete len:208 (+) Transcript_26049:833-1456(+)